MSLLRDIRNQSHGTRKVMFVLSVVTTVSLVGTLWFRSFQSNLYALMNTPEEEAEQEQLADQKSNPVQSESPFAMIGGMFKDLGAQVGGLFGGSGSPAQPTPEQTPIRSGKAQSLPISQ